MMPTTRPTSPSRESRRRKELSVTLSDDEREILERLATEHGVSLSMIVAVAVEELAKLRPEGVGPMLQKRAQEDTLQRRVRGGVHVTATVLQALKEAKEPLDLGTIADEVGRRLGEDVPRTSVITSLHRLCQSGRIAATGTHGRGRRGGSMKYSLS